MSLAVEQNHLQYADRVNLGAYYTQSEFVQIAWDMLKNHTQKDSIILDSSCGYGNFLNSRSSQHLTIGNDIDTTAILAAKNKNKTTQWHNVNALKNVSRSQYGIDSKAHLCIVGNPPYNDRTSIIRSHIKSSDTAIDNDIQTRDLGMSFLLSYEKLQADVICVLHPLSYLIKKSNFNLLKKFSQNYQLVQGKIISSNVFSQSSKSMAFPIVIALYKKISHQTNTQGTTYEDINRFPFEVVGGCHFSTQDFDTIVKYVKKYPNKHHTPDEESLFFWTMRDINALKRNQTFVQKFSTNTLIIDKNKLEYYIYIDVFKQFSKHIPYYFGNCDVLINNDLFQQYKEYFILEALNRHLYLRQYFVEFDFSKIELLIDSIQKIQQYFQQLLKEHYVS